MSPQNDNGPQWKERFLLTLLQQRNYSERTLKAYGRDVERFIEFLDETQLTPMHRISCALPHT